MSRLLSLLYIALVSGSVLDCSRPNSAFKITSFSFSPDPAIAGKNSTLIVSFNATEAITSGIVNYGISYDYRPFQYAKVNICDTMKCPINPGKYMRKLTYPFPDSLTGNFRLRVNWKDNSTQELMCVSVRTKVSSYSKQLILYPSKHFLPHPICINYENASYAKLVRNTSRSNTSWSNTSRSNTRELTKVNKASLRGGV